MKFSENNNEAFILPKLFHNLFAINFLTVCLPKINLCTCIIIFVLVKKLI